MLNSLRTMFIVVAQIAASVAAATGVRAAEEQPRDLLAAQIRDQGYRCDKPVSAQKDLARSKPDDAVWILRCENGIYRLRLVPDMAASVERLH